MNQHDAIALIEKAVGDTPGVWADLGAGEGTFTQALLPLLGPGSKVYAVDHDRHALTELQSIASKSNGKVVAMNADFARAQEFRAAFETQVATALDGILIANALHFVRDRCRVLHELAQLLRPGGRVVLVEYDRRAASQWVPYPIPISELPALAQAAGLEEFTVTATRPSAYQGSIYAAFARRAMF